MRRKRYVPKHALPKKRRAEKSDRNEKPGQSTESVQNEKPVKVSESVRSGKPVQVSKSVRNEKPVQTSEQRRLKQRIPRRRRYGFLIFILVFIFLILGGITAGAFYLWDYLESFEISRPEHIIEYISDNIDYDFWQESAEEALIPRLTYFETDVSSALEPHLSQIRNVRYSIRLRPDESTDDLLVYTVRAGAADIGIVRFTPKEEAGHGFYIWGVDSMEMLDSFLYPFSRSITITVSQNAQVEVNGILVTGEYLIECEHEYGSTYRINNLYGAVNVSVIEFDGQRPDAIFAQHDEYYFPITIPFDVSYNFIVPYGALVYADGDLISSDHITGSQVISQVFRGVVDQAQVPTNESFRYEFGFKDLYVEPVITVTDAQGKELEASETDDGGIEYKEEYSESLKEAHAGSAEDFMRAYVRFSSNVGGSPEANLNALGNYMLRTSRLFRHLQAAVGTREWNRISQQVTFHELEAYNFRQHGDNYFTCVIYYNVTQRGHLETIDIEMRYEVLYTLSNGRWLVANIIAID